MFESWPNLIRVLLDVTPSLNPTFPCYLKSLIFLGPHFPFLFVALASKVTQCLFETCLNLSVELYHI